MPKENYNLDARPHNVIDSSWEVPLSYILYLVTIVVDFAN